MHVAQPALAVHALDVFARHVEVAADLEHGGAERPHRRGLVRVVAFWHDDRARDLLALTGHGNRLTMVARAGGDHAAPFVGAEVPDEIETATNLERGCRVVVLVLDEQTETGLRLKQRMLEQGRGPQRAIDNAAGGIDI